jgi:SAM-dependent methyltransferase
MSQSDQHLFDRSLLRRRRERVAKQCDEVDYLLQRAAEELDERLDMVLREFPLALDLGSGNGILAKRLAARQNVGQVIAADLSPDLLPDLGAIPRLVCDEEFLPLQEQSLSLVTNLLSLHFVNDLPGALIQIRRALKPDGLFLAALPGGRTLHELRTAFMQAEEELTGGVSPRVAPMADVRDYGALLQRAGLALPVVDSDLVTVTFDHPFKLMQELRLMGAGNVLTDRQKAPVSRALLFRVAEIYVERFGEDGRIPASFELIYLSGWAPHESQQQPLQPGSAQMPLASVLSTCALDEEGDPEGNDS